jgi:hypothetical protein
MRIVNDRPGALRKQTRFAPRVGRGVPTQRPSNPRPQGVHPPDEGCAYRAAFFVGGRIGAPEAQPVHEKPASVSPPLFLMREEPIDNGLPRPQRLLVTGPEVVMPEHVRDAAVALVAAARRHILHGRRDVGQPAVRPAVSMVGEGGGDAVVIARTGGSVVRPEDGGEPPPRIRAVVYPRLVPHGI